MSQNRRRPRGYLDSWNPHKRTRKVLDQIDEVLDLYRPQWPLTNRQVFYALVGRYGFPKREADYKIMSDYINKARRHGRIPWEAIRDDGHVRRVHPHHVSPDSFWRTMTRAAQSYTRNKMVGQDIDLVVWCETAGMVPQLVVVTEPYSIQVRSSGGYDSLSAKKEFADHITHADKHTVVLHLGDHDPSGLNMFVVLSEDITAFVEADGTGSVEFQRVALTAEQVTEHDLVTYPAKMSDPRFKNWTGGTTQLEALPPDVIATILRDAIDGIIDADQLADDEEREIDERAAIKDILDGVLLDRSEDGEAPS